MPEIFAYVGNEGKSVVLLVKLRNAFDASKIGMKRYGIKLALKVTVFYASE